MLPSRPDNLLLSHMEADVLDRLQLRRVELPLRYNLERPGEPIDRLYFIEEGLASMTTCFEGGMQVETGLFGYEAGIGISALMGTKLSLNSIFMQLEGHGYAAPFKAAQAEFQRNGTFQRLTLRYVQAQLTFATQNAACNATHNYEQRLARWLLICADRARQEHLELAQEFVSEMLGQHTIHGLDRSCSLEGERVDQLSPWASRAAEQKGFGGGGVRVLPHRSHSPGNVCRLRRGLRGVRSISGERRRGLAEG